MRWSFASEQQGADIARAYQCRHKYLWRHVGTGILVQARAGVDRTGGVQIDELPLVLELHGVECLEDEDAPRRVAGERGRGGRCAGEG